MESFSLRSNVFPRFHFSLPIFFLILYSFSISFLYFSSSSSFHSHCCCYSSSASETRTNPRWVVPFKSSNFLSCSLKPRNLSRFSSLSTQNSTGSVGPGDAVIIVDHGSRRKESNLMLNEFVEMFKYKTGYHIVEPAHMELAEPSIGDAFQSCVQQGANRVIVSPFFLSPGRHWSQDIPSLSAEAAKQHPGVSYIVTAPLGLHELLVDVVNDRINYCLKHVTGDADECSVCSGTGKCTLHQ